MEYTIKLDDFEGPLDLLLHLIKQSDIDIVDISIFDITNQYLKYIHAMKDMNLNVSSEYLVMAAELIEMKSRILLPQTATDEEEDPREELIDRLTEYRKYKEAAHEFNSLEVERKKVFTRSPNDLEEFKSKELVIDDDITLNDLLNAFSNFIERKALDRPLNTVVTSKEYSVNKRNKQIKQILLEKKEVSFEELFDVYNKGYIVVTFLSILDLAKKKELKIKQKSNFNKIYLCVGDN